MRSRKTAFRPVKASLADLLGAGYVEAVCAACSWLTGEDLRSLRALGRQRVEFYPKEFHQRLVGWLPHVGTASPGVFAQSAHGATSAAFAAHSKPAQAPLSASGYYRIGEDGRVFLIAKSEHYHAALGHAFPGYALIDHARRLGIPNATHNNTRGHVTRRLEEELVRAANGIARENRTALEAVLASRGSAHLNRVLNLETGSLAAEAALKMILSRSYQPDSSAPQPKYAGRVPVLVVVGDEDGGPTANYHGTTVLAQTLRGMWPDILAVLQRRRILQVRSIRPNCFYNLTRVFDQYDKGRFKVAGFFHELVLMNYGGIRLQESFVRRAYALCKQRDVPTVVDEIQTGLWSPDFFLFREYGVRPTVVVVGKGFSGGEYAASRVLFSAAMDTLPQFGALVTNGQEELASLAYLITMRWAEANAEVSRTVGEYYQERLQDLADKHADAISAVEGSRHLAGIFFHDLPLARRFAACLNEMGIDISVQAYKSGCPPSALTKLPLTAGFEVVDFLVDRMQAALEIV